MVIYSGFFHYRWWFSIVMLVYQRVVTSTLGYKADFFSPCSAFTVGGRHLEVQPQRAPRLRDSPVDDFFMGMIYIYKQYLYRVLTYFNHQQYGDIIYIKYNWYMMVGWWLVGGLHKPMYSIAFGKPAAMERWPQGSLMCTLGGWPYTKWVAPAAK